MNTWTPLWSGIVDSSLWEEDGDVVKVFMTMLATKNSDHVCELDAYKIGRKCNLDELKVLDILKVLASPDTRRKTPQEFDGRRIEAVDGGWLVLNGEKYRQMVAEEMRKARLRRAQAAFRERKKKGATLKQQVRSEVAHDPITKRDKKTLRGLHASDSKRNGQPEPSPFEAGAGSGDNAAAGEPVAGARPGDADGPENVSG